jgi:hypothetical protein
VAQSDCGRHRLCETFVRLIERLFQSFSSTVSFGLGCDYLARFEGMGEGIQWHNIHRGAKPNDNFSFLSCMIMMLVDALIYLLLTLYIENVFPGEWMMSQRREDRTLQFQGNMVSHNRGIIHSREPTGSVTMPRRFVSVPPSKIKWQSKQVCKPS